MSEDLDAIEDQDSPPAKKKGFMGLTLQMTAGRWLMMGVGGLSLLTAFGVIWLEGRNAQVDTGAKVNVQANGGMHNAPGKSSPAYAAEVRAYNKKQAEAALSHNQSYVGIPVTGTTTMAMPQQQTPIDEQTSNGGQPSQVSIQEPQQQTRTRPHSPAADSSIAKEFGTIAVAMKNERAVNPGVYIPQYQTPEQASGTGLHPAKGNRSGQSKLPAIHPGTIIYGVFENAMKSTMPGPVIGELVQGKYNGDRVIGSFTRASGSNRLEIRLHTLVLPSGKTVSLDAYAISPNTTLPGMATNVNYHVLSRTASFLGAAFMAGVEGYGAAVAQQGSTISSFGGMGMTQTYPMLTPAQTMDIAAGQAAQQLQPIQQQLAQNVMEPDTVTVAQGTPFGLLVVSSGKAAVLAASAKASISASRRSAGAAANSRPQGLQPTGYGPAQQAGYPLQRGNLAFPGMGRP